MNDLELIFSMLGEASTTEIVKTQHKEHLKTRIGHTDDKINRMVYQLYGLTEEEIRMVENFR